MKGSTSIPSTSVSDVIYQHKKNPLFSEWSSYEHGIQSVVHCQHKCIISGGDLGNSVFVADNMFWLNKVCTIEFTAAISLYNCFFFRVSKQDSFFFLWETLDRVCVCTYAFANSRWSIVRMPKTNCLEGIFVCLNEAKYSLTHFVKTLRTNQSIYDLYKTFGTTGCLCTNENIGGGGGCYSYIQPTEREQIKCYKFLTRQKFCRNSCKWSLINCSYCKVWKTRRKTLWAIWTGWW